MNKMQENYNKFYASFEKAVERFRKWDKSETIQIISHLDADGISACAILTSVLNKDNRKYVVSILPQLAKDKIEEIAGSEGRHIIFADLGSGQIKDIKELLKDKEVLILDHHQPEEAEADNITHINPHLFGIDGSKEISGAGVVYLFAKALDKENVNLAHIAVIGAIGDVQEDKGFLHLNQKIVEEAVENEKIKVKTGLRLFGMQTKPVHKVLEYSSDPYIPGVSGSESGAIQFLHQIGVEPKAENKWKKIVDLNDEEMQKLVAGIIMKRFGEENPDDVLGNIYIFPDEEEGTPTRDAKEFATLLNACGRMDKASFGIGTCLGIKKDRQKALETLSEYKRAIVQALNWYNEHKEIMIQGDGFIVINAEDNIPATIIGTLASILSKSNGMKEGTYVLSLARADDNMTKISLRISGLRNQDIDLRDILKEIVDEIGGEAGGHQYAAGALIDNETEQEFLKAAEKILSGKGKV
ncbi:DHH family phosphoesterase [Candidatus Woesearchaeota archaeon]|nr:DHH family phosphoesterase [Candidatus Woesearchaeota archaeon]